MEAFFRGNAASTLIMDNEWWRQKSGKNCDDEIWDKSASWKIKIKKIALAVPSPWIKVFFVPSLSSTLPFVVVLSGLLLPSREELSASTWSGLIYNALWILKFIMHAKIALYSSLRDRFTTDKKECEMAILGDVPFALSLLHIYLFAQCVDWLKQKMV